MGDPIPSPHQPPTARSDRPTSGVGSIPMVWPRVGARVIDEVLWAVPLNAAVIVWLLQRGDSSDLSLDDIPAWMLVVTAVIPAVYEFICLAIWGSTFGKWAVGLGVVSYATGSRPMPYQMGLRTVFVSLGSLLSAGAPPGELRFLLTFVTPVLLFSVTADPIGRGLHDKGAGTLVVRSR